MFEYIEEKEYELKVAVESDQHGNHIHVTNWEDMYDLMEDGYEFNDYWKLSPNNKPINRGNAYWPIYKYGWV